jgi:amidophosphoribosyltransferase
MIDEIKHECGIALIRLRKPMQYYIDKYGSPLYAINKLYLLMEKQVNRGQDGAGVANIKIGVEPGTRYISRYRSIKPQAVTDIFKKINKKYGKVLKSNKTKFKDGQWLKEHLAFSGEVWMGHLRYGTHGNNKIENTHPMLRQNNWRSRNLVVAGNFNMTNVDQQFNKLLELGQHPKEKADTVTVMEKIGHFLDEENQAIFEKYNNRYPNAEISLMIENELDLARVLRRACKDFDGGYAMAGMTGYGAAFVARDPAGIRPAYYYADDEVVVVASEKPAIKTAFNIDYNQIKEIEPGSALIINKAGEYGEYPFIEQLPKKSCSFERIYFSRGTDPDIYHERKQLGKYIVPQVLEAIHHDLENTVFSYIPNTAETAFLGMVSGLEDHLTDIRRKVITEGKLDDDALRKVLSFRPRVEKLVSKDAKLRTFITDDEHRGDMVAHVYETTYEVINKNKDNIVVLDDSIVRGTTLEKSILKLLDRLNPKTIVIVSSAPQIRYPDCYGIDMSKIKDFIAFRATMALLRERDKEDLIDEVYDKCLDAIQQPGSGNKENFVKLLYEPFSVEEISEKIAQIVRPAEINANVKVVYQKVKNLHKACPYHLGDWYFTGDYPTEGGNKVVNKAFVNYMQGKEIRAY